MLDDDAAYSHFFVAQFPYVVRTIYLIVHDRARAEDIAQDAFVQLLKDWQRIARYERPEAWVRRVAIRMAVRGVRRDQLWSSLRTRLWVRPSGEPRDLDVADAVARLPRAQRAAVALFYYEDRPITEIEAILGCTESTARVHLHHARHKLATMLGE
ncbi:MAG: SigE family RNA polymerase sigma factor [Chloroflexi bacterium]|nr:SigE family RNA polymerase sigma factor [Chloroflexota bacterium]